MSLKEEIKKEIVSKEQKLKGKLVAWAKKKKDEFIGSTKQKAILIIIIVVVLFIISKMC